MASIHEPSSHSERKEPMREQHQTYKFLRSADGTINTAEWTKEEPQVSDGLIDEGRILARCVDCGGEAISKGDGSPASIKHARGCVSAKQKNRDPVNMRAAEAMLDGAVEGMRREFPMHLVDVTGKGKGWREVTLRHPIHMPEPRYYQITAKVENDV